jgi:hypothetical protein
MGFKAWLAKKGNDDVISFIDESSFNIFSRGTWWIDYGTTVHITNSSQDSLAYADHKKGEKSQSG